MEIVHTLNRGVDKRDIFMDDQDRFRFVHDLFEFNDEDNVNTTFHLFKKSNDIACRNIERKKRKRLVDVHAFCIMSNHYHLLLSPRVENGVSRFMKKLNMGYAKYFNEKYQRVGTLFQGRYKSVLVKSEPHFIYLPYYIHLNPLDMVSPEWRDLKISNFKKATNYLQSYKWSSFLDYIGSKNFPSVTERTFLLSFFGGTEQYRKGTFQWLKDLNLEKVQEISLE